MIAILALSAYVAISFFVYAIELRVNKPWEKDSTNGTYACGSDREEAYNACVLITLFWPLVFPVALGARVVGAIGAWIERRVRA